MRTGDKIQLDGWWALVDEEDGALIEIYSSRSDARNNRRVMGGRLAKISISGEITK